MKLVHGPPTWTNPMESTSAPPPQKLMDSVKFRTSEGVKVGPKFRFESTFYNFFEYISVLIVWWQRERWHTAINYTHNLPQRTDPLLFNSLEQFLNICTIMEKKEPFTLSERVPKSQKGKSWVFPLLVWVGGHVVYAPHPPSTHAKSHADVSLIHCIRSCPPFCVQWRNDDCWRGKRCDPAKPRTWWMTINDPSPPCKHIRSTHGNTANTHTVCASHTYIVYVHTLCIIIYHCSIGAPARGRERAYS